MKVVGICACTAGIAHTYMAQKKLIVIGEERGHSVFIETQGSMGTESKLTWEQIQEADIVIIATDIKISKDRFTHKKIVEIGTSVAIKSTNQLYEQIEKQISGE